MTHVIAFCVGLAYPTEPGTGREKKPRGNAMETNFRAAIEKSAESTGSIALLLDLYREEILQLVDLHGAHNVRIFGSVARGQAGADSDLDLLVEFDADRSLLDRIALMQDLKDLLGIDVDVVTPRSLHRDLKAQILRDAQPL